MKFRFWLIILSLVSLWSMPLPVVLKGTPAPTGTPAATSSKSTATPSPTPLLTLPDIHAHLVGRGWAVHEIPPLHITHALTMLMQTGLIHNEQSWRALPDPPPGSEP